MGDGAAGGRARRVRPSAIDVSPKSATPESPAARFSVDVRDYGNARGSAVAVFVCAPGERRQPTAPTPITLSSSHLSSAFLRPEASWNAPTCARTVAVDLGGQLGRKNDLSVGLGRRAKWLLNARQLLVESGGAKLIIIWPLRIVLASLLRITVFLFGAMMRIFWGGGGSEEGPMALRRCGDSDGESEPTGEDDDGNDVLLGGSSGTSRRRHRSTASRNRTKKRHYMRLGGRRTQTGTARPTIQAKQNQ
uniref:Uncharacterized protein n=1 Tax=Steinernema glaseri TaxID=37863 RepID=A0A1I7YAK2_9BILA